MKIVCVPAPQIGVSSVLYYICAMLKHTIIFIALLSAINAIAQNDALAEKFARCTNDSAFVMQHSITSPQTITFEEALNNAGAPLHMQKILKTPLHGVVGPVIENGHTLYYKVIRADSTTSMHVAHIIVAHSMHPEGDAENIIRDAYDKLKSGATWTSVVDEYSEDGTVQSDGDLGWFIEGQMVPSFNDACLKMKKGDKTIVKTEYGWHIIWMKSEPKKIRKTVECIMLVTK